VTRYSTRTENAIREAVAAGLRFSETHRKVKAGTLSGLDGPVDMPERTFAGKWSRAKREQQKARSSCPTCGRPRNGSPPAAAGELGEDSHLARIARELEARKAA
jgi:hypothetical protein